MNSTKWVTSFSWIFHFLLIDFSKKIFEIFFRKCLMPWGYVELCTGSYKKKTYFWGRYGFLRRMLGLELDYCSIKCGIAQLGPYVVRFICRDSPYVVHLSWSTSILNDLHYLSFWRGPPQWVPRCQDLLGSPSPQGLAIPSTVTVMATAMNSEYVLHSECVDQWEQNRVCPNQSDRGPEKGEKE